MASAELRVVGAAGMVPPACGASALSTGVSLGVCRSYGAQDAGSFTVASSQALGAAISALRFVAVRSVDGAALVLQVTPVGGSAQSVPFSDLAFLHAPPPATGFSSVVVQGAGRVEFLVAGDP